MRYLVAFGLLAGCGVAPAPADPLPPPSVEDARVLLADVIDAGIDRDWERLCASASGTCEGELAAHAKERAPSQAPQVADIEVHHPIQDGDSWSSGGVLFVLCGLDGLGEPYESEVLVFNDGTKLLATAAVYWVGTSVGLAPPGGGPISESIPGEPRCP